MSLSTYNKKRHFEDTPEPKGKAGKAETKKLTFVVQRHHASHLHYDFRLELNGALKSWAVPKGPSLNPHDKRLAMMVEDHPLDYAGFEGDIPAGNYGAGHVDVWDHGTYEPIDEDGKVITKTEFNKNLYNGSIKFRMKGRHLKGDFALVRLKKEEKSWLLIKHNDEHATLDEYNSEDYAKKSSLAYTEKINKEKGKKAPAEKKKVILAPEADAVITRKRHGPSGSKLNHYIKPMLAKLYDEPFDDPDWIFEVKWDGYRAIAEINKSDIKLYSRNGLSFEHTYPGVYQELNKIKAGTVLDGELAALDEHGKPSFQLLQQYLQGGDIPLCYYVFDCLKINGKSVEQLPLLERKKKLQEILPESDIIQYSDHVAAKGLAFFNAIKKQGLEGMMAKKADSTYHTDHRTDQWLKIKNVFMEEAVIAGYTQSRGSRKYFGALVLGTYIKGKLVYIGHTGTGFNDKLLKEVYELMQPLKTDKSPFENRIDVNAPVTWIKPELVCQLKYSEVTADGHRRHPVFMGLRDDKTAGSVHPEVTAAPEKQSKKVMATSTKKAASKVTVTAKKVTSTPVSAKGAFSHTDKVFWPEEGYTKGDVINYYDKIYKYIGKYLKGRPESLFRTPNGINHPGFFHKDAGQDAPENTETVTLYSDSAEKNIEYIICNDKATLLYMANLGCIEINPWNSTTKDLEKPDYFVMDIDPSKNNTYEQVIETALVIKEILDKAGAPSYPKTSGATGMHIYVPLGAKYTYDQAKDFAHMIAQLANAQLPEFTSLERSLSKRGHDNIYIDYLQNRKGQTLSCAYSLRPKPGATVSTPLEWSEVKKGLHPSQFNIKTIFKRLEEKGDLFGGVLKKGIDMKKCIEQLAG